MTVTEHLENLLINKLVLVNNFFIAMSTSASSDIQGGPAKVRPTYILLVTFGT